MLHYTPLTSQWHNILDISYLNCLYAASSNQTLVCVLNSLTLNLSLFISRNELPYIMAHVIGAGVSLLFKRSKGHGSCCTTTLRGMHFYLYRVYFLTSNTTHLSVQWQSTSKTKRQCAGNTPNTLILANRPICNRQVQTCHYVLKLSTHCTAGDDSSIPFPQYPILPVYYWVKCTKSPNKFSSCVIANISH